MTVPGAMAGSGLAEGGFNNGSSGRLGISAADGRIVRVSVKVATSLAGLVCDPLFGRR